MYYKQIILSALAALILSACNESTPDDVQLTQLQPQEAIAADANKGRVIFVANCAACHGLSTTGTNQGPSLVHKVYKPSHHSNYSIERAIKFGVRSHHWGFGNMPPVPGLSVGDVQQVIAYIRQEQLKAGIQ